MYADDPVFGNVKTNTYLFRSLTMPNKISRTRKMKTPSLKMIRKISKTTRKTSKTKKTN